MKANRSIVFKSAAMVCLLMIFAGAGAVFLEASRCSDALFRCFKDPFIMASITGSAYCLNGYFFCIKFIDPPK
ncbi:MAG: hypothetical protein ACYDH3_01440 [Candidatus Aminicenantales bacterium]